MTFYMLGHTDFDVNALRLLTARTRIRLPARINNFDDFHFSTACDVVKIFVLDTVVKLNRFLWNRFGSFFVVVKTNHGRSGEQRGSILRS